MATNPAVGTRTALTVTGLSTLAAGTYVASNSYNCNTNKPWDVVVEVNVATTNTPVTPKQVLVFLQESLDGTNYRSGPTSGTTTTDEQNLRWIGTIPMNSVSTAQSGTFSVAQVLGYLPFAFKLIIKNETGVALTSGTVFTSEITG